MKTGYMLLILLAVAVVAAAGYWLYNKYSKRDQHANAELVEFTDEPDDSDSPMDDDENTDFMTQQQANLMTNSTDFDMNPQAYSYAYEAGAIRGGSPDQYADNENVHDLMTQLAETDEEFRVSRGGGMRGAGPRGSGVRVGRGGGMGPRGSGRGYRPRHYRPGRRPWRPHYWRRFPNYYYPYNYYSYYYTPYYYPYSYSYNPYFYPGYPMDTDYPVAQAVLRYSVRIMDKQATHPYIARGFTKGYSIIGANDNSRCGVSGAEITLKRGTTYEFDVFTGRDCLTGEPLNEPFFFTTDPVGGSDTGRVFNIKPTVNGVIRITPDENTPNMFFYNSSNNRYLGGVVNVV